MSAKQTQVSSIDDEAGPADKAADKAATAAAATKDKASGHDSELSGKRKLLTVHQGQGDDGAVDVTVSVNGYAYQIKRGEPVDVPAEVVEIMENAFELRYRTEGKNTIESKVPRFAFSVRDPE